MSGNVCVLCGSDRWAALVEPHPSQSVRVDGITEPSPLRRRQCKTCGLGYRVATTNLAMMYGQDFALYSNRPGADAFNDRRHPVFVDRIAKSVHPLRPRRILEVGCGDGNMLSAVRQLWPQAETVGVEPSRKAAEAARAQGHRVIEGMLESSLSEVGEGHFDLIFSIQVIEHTADPVAFLAVQASCLAAGGLMVTVCPNGAVPHAEIIHPDHLFSFTPEHLTAVATQAGLIRLGGCEFVLDETSEFNQLLIASKASNAQPVERGKMPALGRAEVNDLKLRRNAYLRRWSCLEEDLGERVGQGGNIVCFGTGGWSANLAGYAPAIWAQVRACTVDRPGSATHLDKPVVDYSNLHEEALDAVILGVNPGRQDMVSQRLRGDGYRTVQWNDLIDR